MDNDEEDFVFFGTPIEREEDFTSRKKKAIAESSGQLRTLPAWKQEVTDEEGRRRFHGAFTGGFSAGYYNTVGSKEGWTPQSFTSSRKNRAEFKQQSLSYFLDDDEKAEMEGRLGTSMQYDTFGFTAAELARKQAEKEQTQRPSAIPGPVPDEVVLPATESIGLKLLQKMGWRRGRSIKDSHTDSLYDARREARKAFLAFSFADVNTQPLGSGPAEDDADNIVDPPTDDGSQFSKSTPVYVLNPKQDLQGLGYDPYKHAPEFREKKRSRMSKNSEAGHREPLVLKDSLFGFKSGRVAPGFGIGALEDLDVEDEDVYASGTMGKPKKRKQASSTPSNEDARDDVPLAKLQQQAKGEIRTKRKQDASSSQARPQVPRETEANEVEGGDEPVQPRVADNDESDGDEEWRKLFRRRRAYQLYNKKFLDRTINPERVISLKDVDKKNPDIYRRFQKHDKWEQVLVEPLCNANETMVVEFYANLATNKEGDTKVFCRGKYVDVDAGPLNEFLKLENFKPTRFMRKCGMTEKQKRAWLVPIIGREKNPKWKNNGVQIYRGDLNFEAKGWHYILISRIRPTSQDHKLTVHQAVMVGCLVSGIKINLGVEMAKKMIDIAHSDKKKLAFPQTLTAYLTHKEVEKLPGDFFSAPRNPFNWYAFKDDSPAPSASGTPVPPVSALPSTSRADPPHDPDSSRASDTTTGTEPEALPRAVLDLDDKLEKIKTFLSNLPQVQPPPPPPPPAGTPEPFSEMIQVMRNHTLAIEGNTTALAEHTAALRAHTRILKDTQRTVAHLGTLVTGLTQHFVSLDEKISRGLNVPKGFSTPSTAVPPAIQPSKAPRPVTSALSGPSSSKAPHQVVKKVRADYKSRRDLEATKAMRFDTVDDDDTDDDMPVDDDAELQLATHLSLEETHGQQPLDGKGLA